VRGAGTNGLIGDALAHADSNRNADARSRPAEDRHSAGPVPNPHPVAISNPNRLTLAATIRQYIGDAVTNANAPAVISNHLVS